MFSLQSREATLEGPAYVPPVRSCKIVAAAIQFTWQNSAFVFTARTSAHSRLLGSQEGLNGREPPCFVSRSTFPFTFPEPQDLESELLILYFSFLLAFSNQPTHHPLRSWVWRGAGPSPLGLQGPIRSTAAARWTGESRRLARSARGRDRAGLLGVRQHQVGSRQDSKRVHHRARPW